MTMIIALNAVPPEKNGLVAAAIGITLTVGGIAGPLISGTLLMGLLVKCLTADSLSRWYLQQHHLAMDLLHKSASWMHRVSMLPDCVAHERYQEKAFHQSCFQEHRLHGLSTSFDSLHTAGVCHARGWYLCTRLGQRCRWRMSDSSPCLLHSFRRLAVVLDGT